MYKVCRAFISGLLIAILALILTGCGGKGKSRENPVGAKLDRGSPKDSELARSDRHLKIRAALDRGDGAAAERLALKEVEQHPKDAEAQFLLAKSLIAQNQLIPARDHLEKAVTLQSDNTAYRRVLGEVLDQQAQDFLKKEKPEKAIAAWKRCLDLKYKPRQIEDSLAEAYSVYGDELISQQKLEEAETALKEAAALLPENPQPSLGLAKLFISSDRLSEAQLLLRELNERFPKFEEGRVAYANLLQRTGDIRGAMGQVDNVLGFAPGNKEALSLKGELAKSVPVNKSPDTEPVATGGADEPDSATLEKLTSLESAGDLKGQAELLKQIIKDSPTAMWAKLRGAQMNERLGNATEALMLTEEYLTAKPDDARAKFLQARCLQTIGQFESALTLMQSMEKENSANLQVTSEIGQIQAKMGRFEDARESWNKALKIDPEFAGVLFNFGQLAMEQGKNDEARDFFDRATRKEPFNLKFRYFAGLNMKQAGKPDAAQAIWKSAKSFINPQDLYGARILRALGEKVPDPAARNISETAHSQAAALPDGNVATATPSAAVAGEGSEKQGVAPMAGTFTVVKSATPAPGTDDPRYRAALDAARAGNYQEAIDGFQTVLAQNPNSFNTLMNLGNAYLAAGKIGDAAAMYLKGLRIDQKNPHALKALARAYDLLGLKANARGLQHQPPDGNAPVVKSNPRAYEPVVRAFLSNGLSEEALPLINSAVEENPESSEFLVMQGEVLSRLSKADLAESSFRKAMELDKQNPLAYLKLGDMYSDMKRPDQALTEYQSALKAKFIDADTMFEIHDRFKTLGKMTEAADVINRLKGMNLSDSQMEKLKARQGS